MPPHLRYDDPAAFRAAAEAAGLTTEALYWLPLAPGPLARLQGVLDNRLSKSILQAVPAAGARFSHSFILRARRT